MRSLSLVSFVLIGCGLLGCGQRRVAATGDVQTPYGDNRTTVIGTDDAGGDVGGSTDVELVDGDCVEVGAQCVVPDTSSGDFCEAEGGPSDVIVVDGANVEVICYPPRDGDGPQVVVDTDQDGGLDVPQNQNNTTVVFDEDTNGTPIEGDLTIDGNNVAIYGNGADDTIIAGNVTLDGNNVRLRGLTIEGDLIFAKNNTAAVLVRVLGNVIILGNNDVFAASDVFGEVQVSSNNVVLVQNRVQGDFAVTGQGPVCDGNRSFADENTDQAITDDEIGDELICQ